MNLNSAYSKFLLAVILSICGAAYAACKSGVASSTVYFIPHVKDYCPGGRRCAAFEKQVKMQGSGVLGRNTLLLYNMKTRSTGSCDTAFGASGACLIPFISVAADKSQYRMGDMIEMPGMKGKRITLANGNVMVHPGYFLVQDTGGAVKGSNRFDFFTGTVGPNSSKNAFGSKGSSETSMIDKNSCSARKSFRVLRKGSAGYKSGMAAIQSALGSSTSGSSSGGGVQ